MFAKSSEKLFKSWWEVYPFAPIVIGIVITSLPFITRQLPYTIPYLSALVLTWVFLFLLSLYFVYIPKGKSFALAIGEKHRGVPSLQIEFHDNSCFINPFQRVEAIMNLRPRVIKQHFSFDLPGRKLVVKVAFECQLNSDTNPIIEELHKQKQSGIEIDETLGIIINVYLNSRIDILIALFGCESTGRGLNNCWKVLGKDLQSHLQSHEKNYTIGEITFMQPYMQMDIGTA